MKSRASVVSIKGKVIGSTTIPLILKTLVRQDIVNFVYSNIRKNKRQPYGVKCDFGPSGIVSGHQHSAKSWGTGRAVSRIPRISGSGTHRAGQGAFGNMCRGGRMFAPTKTFRRWHRKINSNQKRQAVSCCLSASNSPPLIEARGHIISESVHEIPIIVEGMDKIKTTKDLLRCFIDIGLKNEIKKCKNKQSRPGKGKFRRCRYKRRCGPLIICKDERNLLQISKNIPGIDISQINSLNILKLAPGGHIGRLIIWTKKAFQNLEYLRINKFNPKVIMKNSDIHSILNNDEIQSIIRPKIKIVKNHRKRNLLKSRRIKFETFRGFSIEELLRNK